MNPSYLKQRLTDLLIRDKVITEEQLKQAIAIQRQKGGHLSRLLVQMGFVTEKDLVGMLSQGLNIPSINLNRITVDAEVVKIIPPQIARFYQVIPVSRLKNQLTVVMSDPLNVLALDEIRVLTGYEIKPVITTEAEITQAIDKYYSMSASKDIEYLLEDMKKTDVEVLEDREKEKEESETAIELLKLADQAPVIKITNKLLAEAVRRKASDLLIEPMEKEMRVRYRIDGVLVEAKAPPRGMHHAIISRIKVLSRLNIAEHRLPQDGRFKIKLGENEVNFRVSVLPTTLGEKAALRVLDKASLTLDLDRLGFESENLLRIKDCLSRPHGMILVCGPTGSGKTTTLYSMLKYVDSIEKNLITVEDPVEFQLDGINQVPVKERVGLTFSAALRSILRQDPNVIMVGEIRDYPTVDIAIKSALTGHLVFSTLHTNTACGSIIRLVNMGVEPFLITASVIMVAAQRLLRRLCQSCRQPYEIEPKLLEKMNLKDHIKQPGQFYKGVGCQACEGTGYKGRIGIIEVLVLNEQIKEAILSRAPERVVSRLAVESGMRTLREDALKKAEEGITTLEDVIRLTAVETRPGVLSQELPEN